eukprot:CAMPEP_0170553336 /NCGR_PEP_ID=MMETSP0211-20121228/11153_1 /TAXON_ID=311385 /ORGANISM="Pseudokeronopsis sp., Strain OXSARD2" /LENGTH=33 /DNA_ID= /DNA_START= /DNA_END= /DNA_ORIENTATION=
MKELFLLKEIFLGSVCREELELKSPKDDFLSID